MGERLLVVENGGVTVERFSFGADEGEYYSELLRGFRASGREGDTYTLYGVEEGAKAPIEVLTYRSLREGVPSRAAVARWSEREPYC